MSEIKDKEKREWLKTLGLGAAAIATAGTLFLLSQRLSPTTLRGDILANYIIFQERELFKALNGVTGNIDFQDYDATIVIQKAIEALYQRGGRIFIRNGVYVVRGFEIDNKGVPIIIEGEGNTVLRRKVDVSKEPNYGNTFLIRTGNGANNIVIRNIIFEAEPLKVTPVIDPNLPIAGEEQFHHISFSWARKPGGRGYNIINDANILIEDCIFRNNPVTGTNNEYIWFSPSSYKGTIIRRCIFYQEIPINMIRVDYASDVVITENVFRQDSDPLITNVPAVTLWGTDNPISEPPFTDITGKNFVTNNIFYNTSLLLYGHSALNVIANNTFILDRNISPDLPAQDWSFITVAGTNATEDNPGYNGSIIANNTILTDFSKVKIATYGIRIGNNTDVKIVNNTVIASWPFVILGSGRGCHIEGNTFIGGIFFISYAKDPNKCDNRYLKVINNRIKTIRVVVRGNKMDSSIFANNIFENYSQDYPSIIFEIKTKGALFINNEGYNKKEIKEINFEENPFIYINENPYPVNIIIIGEANVEYSKDGKKFYKVNNQITLYPYEIVKVSYNSKPRILEIQL
jgi:hypothetical protein